MGEDNVLSRATEAKGFTPAFQGIPAHSDINERTEIAAKPARRNLTQSGTINGVLRYHRELPNAAREMLADERAYGHFFLFVPVLIGAGAIVWFRMPGSPNLWLVLSGFLIVAAVASIFRHHESRLYLLLAALALFLFGMLLAEAETRRKATVILDAPVTTHLTGIVERREMDGNGRWRYQVRVIETKSPTLSRPPQQVTLLVRSRHEPIASGEVIAGKARLSPPSGPALPGLNDFAFASYFDGIGAVGFLYGKPESATVPVPDVGITGRVERWLFDLRGAIGDRIRNTVPGDAGAFAAAIVTDERRAISEETTNALRLSGLAHIVAISGLNMALAAGIFFVGARSVMSLFTGFAQAYPVKKLAAFAALLMVTAYYLISGFGVSAERAYIMMAVLLVAVLLDRPSISLRNVAIAALIIIVLSPSEILGPSFQMSFAATLALVAGYALWTKRNRGAVRERLPFSHPAIQPLRWIWNFAAGVFVTSLIGGISTAIYSIDHFHNISTYGLAANLAAMPIISFLVMPAGLVGMLLMPFGLDAPFMKLMGYGLQLVIAIAKEVAGWGGDVAVGRQHPLFLAIASAGFLLLMLLRTRLRLIGLPVLIAAIALSSLETARPLPDMLIAEDGTMIALLDGKTIATNRIRPPDFIYDQWRRALLLPDPAKPELRPQPGASSSPVGDRAPLPPEAIRTATETISKAPEGKFVCLPKALCAAKTGTGTLVAIVEDGRYIGAACDAAKLVIAASARFETCRSRALLISGKSLRKTGALELFLNESNDSALWTANAAMADRHRPWTSHRSYDWRSRGFDISLPEPVRRMISDNDE